MRKSRTAAALGAIVAAAALAGCGASTVTEVDQLSPAAAVQRAAESLGDGASFSMEMSGTGTVKAHGTFQLSPKPALDVVFDEMTFSAGMPMGAFKELLLAADALYVRAELPGTAGDKWLKMPLGGLSGAAGGDVLGGLLAPGANGDLQSQLELLLSSGDVRKVGVETVDGHRTTHYAGDLSREELLAAVDVSEKAREAMQSSLNSGGVDSVDLDLWVDRNYLARQFAIHVPSADGGSTAVKITFSDLGTPVSITAPPAADVMDFESMIKGSMDAFDSRHLKDLDVEKLMKGLDLGDPA